MKDRDCESCKKFSRVDPYESEGYCEAKRTWVDPQEGEDCKMHEFTLHSATKYKDGTPIMTEPEKVYCDTDSALIHGKIDRDWVSSYPKCKEDVNSEYGIAAKLSNQLDSLEQRVDELSEEYDAVLKTHGDTLERHMERIEDLDDVLATHAGKINNHTDALLEHEHKLSTLSEDVEINEGNIDALCSDVEELQRKVAAIYQFINSAAPGAFFKILEELKNMETGKFHNGSNFCGNCTHANSIDGICTCKLNKGIVDPDDSSCSMFEPPF